MKKTLFALFALLALTAACSSDSDTPTTDNNGGQQTVEHLDSNYMYRLPVIFHVLYSDRTDPNQYIPYQRIVDILSYVNQIYEGGIYGESANTHVRFVLAETDESGKQLRQPGVEYVHYTGEYPIDVNAFMSDETGANVKYIWEPNNYINVMLFNFKSDSEDEVTLGISHMPFSLKGDHELPGLATLERRNVTKRNLLFPYSSCINSLYANRQSNGTYYQSDRYTNANHQPTYLSTADIVVTVAHELGHYLGLFHAFSEQRNSGTEDTYEAADICDDTDYCTDTYTYNRYEYLQYVKTLTGDDATAANMLRRNSCDGVEYRSANIMDYSLTLGYKISEEQKARIRNVLNYSPLIPGPKIGTTTRAAQPEAGSEPMKIRFTLIK